MVNDGGDIFRDKWTEVHVRWDFAVLLFSLVLGLPFMVGWSTAYWAGERVPAELTYVIIVVGVTQVLCVAARLLSVRRQPTIRRAVLLWFVSGYACFALTFLLSYALVSIGWHSRLSAKGIIGLPMLSAIAGIGRAMTLKARGGQR